MRTILFLTLLLSAATVYAAGFTPDQAASFPDPDLVANDPDQVMRPEIVVGVQPQVPGAERLIAGTTYIACGPNDLRIAAEWTWVGGKDGKCSEIKDISAA